MAPVAAIKRLLRRLPEWGCAGLFLTAGLLKAADPAAFALDVHHYRLLPWRGSVVLALYLPWLEIVAGLALLFRRFQFAAAVMLSVLMTVFLAALISAAARGIDVACGCFGHSRVPSSLPEALFRDALILGVLVYLLRATRPGRAQPPVAAGAAAANPGGEPAA